MSLRSDLIDFRWFLRFFSRRLGALCDRVVVFAAGAAVLGAAVLGTGVLGSSPVAEAQSGGDPAVRLYPGWNNVRYQGIVLPTEQALGDAAAAVSVVWKLDAPSQTWLLWGRALPAALLTLPTLAPGGIYFVLSADDRVWNQPLTPPAGLPPPPSPATPPPEDPPADAEPSVGLWQVSFSRTTVLFTLEERVVFEANGQGRVSTTSVAPTSVTISAVAVAAVNTILEENDFFRTGPLDTRSGCTSCFRYTIEIRDPIGGSVTLQTDGVGAAEAQRGLVDQLTSILIGVLP